MRAMHAIIAQRVATLYFRISRYDSCNYIHRVLVDATNPDIHTYVCYITAERLMLFGATEKLGSRQKGTNSKKS